ncbi:hypothetical protein BOTBODRAFT_34121 [Botryobasidium botryosum FD-172 SS1]|uniref:Uncharacterized protein n=1 Tax=Botryobasidium botryosum (strain FD-172 SS1) TaxID=930990 RepID=A0A067MN32_BOTB1|nr:hypothetical protein BOTBODRAFT_34121 [Botryobasidium botryosum FD-172 SS1]
MDEATFESWAHAAQVAPCDSVPTRVAVELSFSPEIDAAYNRRKLPKNVLDLINERRKALNPTNQTKLFLNQKNFYEGFGYIRKDEETIDTYDVAGVLEFLFIQAPRIHSPAASDPSPSAAWRAAYRRGVDVIVEHAFSPLESSWQIELNAMARLRAPHPPLENFDPDVIADVLVTTGPRPIEVGGGLNRSQCFWQTSADQASVSIIGFAVQYEIYDSKRREDGRPLGAILSTAQSQRRALGLKDATIYGATIVCGECRVFASWWDRHSRICFGPTGHFFRFWQSYDLVRWYVLLCKIRTKVRELDVDLGENYALGDPSGAAAWRASDPD